MVNGIDLPTPSPTSRIFTTIKGGEIDDTVLERCAKLFSGNYGIWGEHSGAAKAPKPGSRVKMSSQRLRQQCVAAPENTVLVVCYQRTPDHQDPELVGHAFATAWDYEGGRVGWVTQLVVSLTVRRRYIATGLLQMLKDHPIFRGITAIGLASSHPSACHALSKYTDFPIDSFDMEFCRQNVKAIMETSPVDYIRGMKLRGALFEDNCTSGAISCVFTNFYVDHTEPLDALRAYRARGPWLLGELLEGHEFLIILPVY